MDVDHVAVTHQTYQFISEPQVVGPQAIRLLSKQLVLTSIEVASRAGRTVLADALSLGVQQVIGNAPIDVAALHAVEGAIVIGRRPPTSTSRAANAVRSPVPIVGFIRDPRCAQKASSPETGLNQWQGTPQVAYPSDPAASRWK